jgi:hypothetical protein
MEFTYKLLENQPNSILRVEDGAIIPQGNNGDWQLFEAWLLLGNTPLPADELPPNTSPNPTGFYEKLIGVEGVNPLYQVYTEIITAALNPNIDTSSLNVALTIYNGALKNDWSKPYAIPAYASAYNILKQFLTQEQIEVIDAENVIFNLV